MRHPQPVHDSSLKLESLHRYFEAEIADVDRELVAYLQRFEGPETHYGMIRYHFGYADQDRQPLDAAHYLPRGKRLRPLICMLFCRMLRLPRDVAAILMMATEVMHSASLAHDDIEDKDGVRWGRPTIHSLFGLEHGINAGDALIGMVYQILLTLPAKGVDPQAALDVIEIFNHTHLAMCEGQHLDLSHRYYASVGVADYLDMVRRKTAAPCVCIADSISRLAGCPPATRTTLHSFGLSLGMLYQICDDIRGLWADPDALGRQIGQDISQQRASLPLLYAYKDGSAEIRAMLREISLAGTPPSDAMLAHLRQELTARGIHRRCYVDAARYYHAAVDALESLAMPGAEVTILGEILGTCFASVAIPAEAP